VQGAGCRVQGVGWRVYYAGHPLRLRRRSGFLTLAICVLCTGTLSIIEGAILNDQPKTPKTGSSSIASESLE
jgi:hypothetical protein